MRLSVRTCANPVLVPSRFVTFMGCVDWSQYASERLPRSRGVRYCTLLYNMLIYYIYNMRVFMCVCVKYIIYITIMFITIVYVTLITVLWLILYHMITMDALRLWMLVGISIYLSISLPLSLFLSVYYCMKPRGKRRAPLEPVPLSWKSPLDARYSEKELPKISISA